MAKRISEDEKTEIINDFIKNKTLEEIAEKFDFTKVTITKHLKLSLGEDKFTELNKLTKSSKKYGHHQNLNYPKASDESLEKVPEEAIAISQDSFPEDTFLEIAPLNLEIDNKPQIDLSSVSIKEVELPKVVYMIVDKQIELKTKLLKEYVEWNFLSENDLRRNTIEIFYDLKTAKRSIKKEQKILKVPNSDVFRIAAPILLSRGISRIVSSDALIAL
ncbi:hypothetical protein CU313_06745 [Prochlorococcus marinus str. MU1404]|uniref:hypothetical protein n=1 Tax=Prochlorococcus marinus TaxID=1219 RepID=UPI001ADA0CDF|nr:hypothetical protein [Prochlorococcus marinus]MBO8230520.1 hypothetical protein [Prochlorococcus marinus XMU1404]MBW3073566.1 hypothetical protein [Prochlorococcus marinus str. MU1404]MCR8545146.1 hypothetical protein [Prochlorococcus marinus CUG1432]